MFVGVAVKTGKDRALGSIFIGPRKGGEESKGEWFKLLKKRALCLHYTGDLYRQGGGGDL